MPKLNNTAIPASYLYLERKGKILLLKRKNTGYEDGNYSLIAGHVEEGENFTQCVIRETREEAGIILNPENLKPVHTMYRNSNQNFSHQRIEQFFTTSHWEGEIMNREPDKCEDLSWFDKDNLPVNIIPYIRLAIDNISKGINFYETGWNIETLLP